MTPDVYMVLPPLKQSIGHRWKTRILRGFTGAESRAALYSWPRFSSVYTLNLLDYPNINRVKRYIFGHLNGVWGVPIWPDKTLLTSQANSAQAILTLEETDYRHFTVGRELMLVDPASYTTVEIGTILTIDSSTQITLDANLSNTWSINTLVVPVIESRTKESQSIRKQFINYDTLTLQFEEDFTEKKTHAYTLPVSGALTLNSLDVLETVPGKAIQLSYNSPLDSFNGDPGLMVQATLQDVPSMQTEVTWRLRGRQDIDSFFNFFDSKRGKWAKFWMPTWNRDIVVTAAIGGSDTVINIQNVEYNTFYPVGQEIGYYVYFIFPSGNTYIRSIQSAGATTITVDSAMEAETNYSRVFVSFLNLVRFDTDEVELEFPQPNLARVKARIYTLPEEAYDA